jgi:23S rRNA (uridine2552-2'-O)-methyltransferase
MPREQDHYAKRARSEGYPARSVYKLEEIDKRFNIIKKGARVLDIGASPGSWSMYAARLVGRDGHVVGVDLQDEKPDLPEKSFTFIRGDAFTDPVLEKIRNLGPYRCLLSDAAPSTTGNRTVDTARSYDLVEQFIGLAAQILAPGGNLVAKIFQGGDERELLEVLKTEFTVARIFKPKSSRKESFEVFLVATGFVTGMAQPTS